MSDHDTTTHRAPHMPGLDALRAIAVVAVVVYHLEPDLLPGGFLGVDLFFVISGYLITTLLLREHRATGSIGYRHFYARRFRRLVPPMAVVVLAAVIGTRLLGVPEQWSSVRADGIATLLYVANWHFITEGTSYFTALLGPSPLRHMWSLAIEEQFYMVWPLVVALLVRARRAAPALMLAAAAASAAWMAVVFDPADPSRAYFGTDTRAQQLLVGAALGWWCHERSQDPARHPSRRAVFAFAVAGFAVLTVVVSGDDGWLYRGGFLVISLLCAALVWTQASPVASSPWLRAPAVQWIGQRSYGLYLWHWPVFVLLDGTLLRIGLTLMLAELSHRLIERPTRISARPHRTVIGGWVTAALAIAAVTAIVLETPVDRAFADRTIVRPTDTIAVTSTDTAATTSPVAAPITTVAEARQPIRAATASTASTTSTTMVAPPNAPAAATAATSSPYRLLLLGDSTALKLFTDDPHDDPIWHDQAFAQLGCGLVTSRLVDAGDDEVHVQAGDCDVWRDNWQLSVDSVQPDVVVLMFGAWEVLDYVVDGTLLRYPSPEWRSALDATVAEAIDIAASGGAPVVVVSVPCMEQSGASDVSALARNDPARVAAVNDALSEAVAPRRGVSLADVRPVLCAADGSTVIGESGDPLRYDGVHVTPEGARVVWRWIHAQAAVAIDSTATAAPSTIATSAGTRNLGMP